jgi:AcrR family transcriptional regulator
MNENVIVKLEKEGIVTSTFRKLAPQKKKNIWAAGLELFARDLYDRVTLDMVASKAGISKGSLIQYFDVKGNLLNFIVAILANLYREHCQDYFQRESSTRAVDRIAGYLKEHFAFWTDREYFFRFYINICYYAADWFEIRGVDNVIEMQRQNVADIVDRGISTGEIRSDTSIERVILAVLSIQEGITREIIYSGEQDIRSILSESIARQVRLLFEGIESGRPTKLIS